MVVPWISIWFTLTEVFPDQPIDKTLKKNLPSLSKLSLFYSSSQHVFLSDMFDYCFMAHPVKQKASYLSILSASSFSNNSTPIPILLGLRGDQTSQSSRTSVLNIHWKAWCWSWNSNTLASWCEEMTHLKRPWGAGGSYDGGGIGWGDHFLLHKFIKRTFEHSVNSTKQLLNAGRGHQAPRKAAH